MPERRFLAGLDLAGSFYERVVRPRLAAIDHAAALIGPGSDVLGHDDIRSTDHFWGPRLQIFVEDRDVGAAEVALRDLPAEHLGWPTRIGSNRIPFRQFVDVCTVPQWCTEGLGFNAEGGVTTLDWLTVPQQLLLEATAGRVFYDGIGRLEALRAALAWYPHDVWLWLLASQWVRISQEQAFVGRAAEVGDDLGSRIVTARLVRDLMRLCFLQERAYAPYSKWLGAAFARLEAASTAGPALAAALEADTYPAREAALTAAYEDIGRRQNDLGVSRSEDARVGPFHSRPYLVSAADRFAAACVDAIGSASLRQLPLVGGVDQWVDSTDVLSRPERARGLAAWYMASLGLGPEKDGGMTTAAPALYGVHGEDVDPRPARWENVAAQNRTAWDEIADVRIHRWSNREYTADFFANGGCSLDPRLRDALGDVNGLRALHLMCATGEESLSLAVLGAQVTAVDISTRQVELASKKARAAGLKVAFVAADVGALPAPIAEGGFDLVYTGGGVLVWVPDIKRWAAVIASALRPGGRFLIWDYHPVAMRWETVDGQLRLDRSYFAGPGPLPTRGWTHFAAPADAQTLKYEFTWTLGEIVTALANAGLSITRVSEFPTDATWKFGDALHAAQALPGLVLLVARRQ
ncbi:MAG TPA: DUF4037 domain-containing protein [Egibacteraceae bacterium]|nr:DUF4037 domain-containing protein [Egibacteraceae bacterium]